MKQIQNKGTQKRKGNELAYYVRSSMLPLAE